MTKLFVINPQDAYAGTEVLAYETIAAHPERPSAAHVCNGMIAVWSKGQYGDYWDQRKASAEQVDAYDRAPRVAVTATPPAAAATTPPATSAVVPTSAAALLTTATATAGANSWENIVATAMRAGLMTEDLMQASLRLLAHGGPPAPTASASRVKSTPIDSAAIYAAHNNRGHDTLDPQSIYARRQANEPQQLWDDAVAKISASQPQRLYDPRAHKATLDPATIYARIREQEADAAALWNKGIASALNPQRN